MWKGQSAPVLWTLALSGPRLVYSVLGAKLVTFKSRSVVSENELRHHPFSAISMMRWP